MKLLTNSANSMCRRHDRMQIYGVSILSITSISIWKSKKCSYTSHHDCSTNTLLSFVSLYILTRLQLVASDFTSGIMRQLRWLILPTETLICLIVLICSCTGNDEDTSKYLYESADEKHFVREFTGDSDSHPDFIYSPNYTNGRLVTYYAE